MTVGIVAVMFVAAAMVAVGAFAAAWRRDATAALFGIPLIFGGGGIAFVGVARFAARAAAAVPIPSRQIVVGVSGPPLGQAAAVLFAIVALALVAMGMGMAGRAARAQTEGQKPAREGRR